jgi:hypothetical protein
MLTPSLNTPGITAATFQLIGLSTASIQRLTCTSTKIVRSFEMSILTATKENEMHNIKIKSRNAGGWNGAHGTAYTVTAELSDGKRAVVKREMFGGKVVLKAKGERLEMSSEEWKNIWNKETK